jgi:hypothetical protein
MKDFKRFNREEPWYTKVYVKLIIYIVISCITSLIADLSHYTCHDSGFGDITPVHWIVIGLNFILQGVIAWRAFIDESSAKYREYLENYEDKEEEKIEKVAAIR